MSAKAKKVEAPEPKPMNPASKRLLAVLTHEYQQNANGLIAEAMQIDGVDPKDGWQLDPQTMTYVKPAQA